MSETHVKAALLAHFVRPWLACLTHALWESGDGGMGATKSALAKMAG